LNPKPDPKPNPKPNPNLNPNPNPNPNPSPSPNQAAEAVELAGRLPGGWALLEAHAAAEEARLGRAAARGRG